MIRSWRSLATTVVAIVVSTISVQAGPREIEDEKETRPPARGEEARDFELTSARGEKTKLSTLTKDGPVVLVVLRGFPGYQCPLCSVQATKFLEQADKFRKAGASVVFIYPGAAEGLKRHSEEFLRGRKLPRNFQLLLDPDYTFTEMYKLRWNAPGETAYPATFIIDSEQVVQFSKVSRTHGDRATVDEALRALESRKPDQP